MENGLPIIIHAFVIFCGGFAWVLALGQIALKTRTASNYMLAVFLFLFGWWQMLGGLVFAGAAAHFRFNVYAVSVPVFFLSVPFIYFYFQCLINPGYRFGPGRLVHLVLPLVSFALLLPYAFEKIDLYSVMNILRHTGYKPYEIVIALVMYASMLLYMGYLAVLLKDIFHLIGQMQFQRRRTLRSALAAVSFFAALNIFWFVDRFFSLGLSEAVYVLSGLTAIALYLGAQRYPEYLMMIREEAERVRYARTQIDGIDAGEVIRRLETVMDTEKAYRDESLNLRSLADRLEVTPHQLSEIINKNMSMNFYSFVNGYRIAEARDILVQDPQRKIIAIAYDVGFNSPSAFYNAFKKATGHTPTAFRETFFQAKSAPV